MRIILVIIDFNIKCYQLNDILTKNTLEKKMGIINKYLKIPFTSLFDPDYEMLGNILLLSVHTIYNFTESLKNVYILNNQVFQQVTY